MLKAVDLAATGTPPDRCHFPHCTVPVPPRAPGRPGAPRQYCDNPEHNAQKALRRRLKEAERDAGAEPVRPSLRPVTDGILTLAALLDRYEHLRGELAAVATDTAELITELTDPTALDREIAEIQRDATRRITAAEQARADAEQATAAMRERIDRAVELEQLAIAAAEEATETAEQAGARLAQVEQDAAARIAEVEADRDRVYEEAETVLTEMRGHVDSARVAHARAEAERDAARQQAESTAAKNQRLSDQLDHERAEHRQQLERRDADYSRAITAAHAMADRAAREHRQQLSEVLRGNSHGKQPPVLLAGAASENHHDR
ncbi:hypothetical protein [Nocardia asiatica]|uniref:hypothetical protein n=1 Tax=Nocardia asiatica TaxID=209252 RepID=UPI0012F86981|nr:hypothetical protein [Nocardia asiatica]